MLTSSMVQQGHFSFSSATFVSVSSVTAGLSFARTAMIFASGFDSAANTSGTSVSASVLLLARTRDGEIVQAGPFYWDTHSIHEAV